MRYKALAVTIIIFSIIAIVWYGNTEGDVIGETIEIAGIEIPIEIADTINERALGLSNRESLAEGTGLLFVFEDSGYYQFWMKNMNFPIDIAWINDRRVIVHIEKAVSPLTYPKTFTSKEPAKYVLETNADFFENSGIKIGDEVKF